MRPMHLTERDKWVDDGDADYSRLVLASACGLPGQAGAWHELHPIIVELGRDGNSPMMLFVSGSEWVRSLDDLVVAEWAGPLEVPH